MTSLAPCILPSWQPWGGKKRWWLLVPERVHMRTWWSCRPDHFWFNLSNYLREREREREWYSIWFPLTAHSDWFDFWNLLPYPLIHFIRWYHVISCYIIFVWTNGRDWRDIGLSLCAIGGRHQMPCLAYAPAIRQPHVWCMRYARRAPNLGMTSATFGPQEWERGQKMVPGEAEPWEHPCQHHKIYESWAPDGHQKLLLFGRCYFQDFVYSKESGRYCALQSGRANPKAHTRPSRGCHHSAYCTSHASKYLGILGSKMGLKNAFPGSEGCKLCSHLLGLVTGIGVPQFSWWPQ